MTDNKQNRTFRLDRLFWRYLKDTQFEFLDLQSLALFLEKQSFIRILENERYEQIKNISRENLLKLLKNEVIL